MKTTILFLLAAMLFATTMLAADVTGKWTAEVPGRNGQTRTQTFDLKADGASLTGTVSAGQMGDTKISDGKVDGDTISFSVVREFNGNSMKINYTGKVSGETIQFKSQREGADRTNEFTAKKAQ